MRTPTYLDLLDEPLVRERLGMYVGSPAFQHFAWWMRGYEQALLDFAPPDRAAAFVGFREWLHMNLEGPGNTDWVGIISWKYGDGQEATTKFFELWDRFRTDLDKKGLETILEQHKEYEIKRYGLLVSSTLACQHKVHQPPQR